ncbi:MULTISPECIES: penicillin-binding protein 1A [Ramlibacter]|uniref:Penicillin-binding protein n=1 Tax=Ramlibacter pinisoli TaxID=2682844 RepID=A0A6N8IX46_9BURK|nr:transglycosylase domain-containing protein [Ramlibacter sp. CGMCC 1.13660]MVQ30563.1 penicillin-binding protein [Ramlibacter pinisoli]
MSSSTPDRAASRLAGLARRTGRGLRRHPWLLLGVLLLAAAGIATAMALSYVTSLIPLTPGIGDLRKVQAEQPGVILTADGQPLAVLRRANRQWVPLAEISPHVLDALLATEDQRFYAHHGVDLRRTAAAALHTARGRLQGGSTITQQLARNLFPEEIGRAPTVERKIKEAITALRIEQVYGKDEILEIYLNTVPFLYNAWGIEMAARTYFDKAARELDVLESATLVGMLKGTSYYNPVTNPRRALQRRNIVLAQLDRQGKLQGADLAALQQSPLRLDFERQDEPPGPAPHLSVQLRRWLIEWAERHGRDAYADGLVVRTTIDARAQALAVEAVDRQAARLQKLADAQWNGRTGWRSRADLVAQFIRESAQFQAARAHGLSEQEAIERLRADADFMQALREDKTRLQAGFVAIEPGTGYVRAWVGSRDFALDQFDHVQQARRQPGSTFKPFVYGAAFEQGARPDDRLLDQAVEIQVGTSEVWRPSDMGQPSGEAMTLSDALAFSRNTVTAQLTRLIGPDRVALVARSLGVRDSRLDPVLSLGLGTSPVTLREMVTAYASIANNGQYVPPLVVLRVEDRDGKLLEAFEPAAPEQALLPAANGILLDAMRGVVDRGTGAAIRSRHGLKGDLAGKTGTTQENTDGWFILAHPRLVAGAWVGYNDSRLTMQDAWGQGARSALPMVGDFFQQALKARLLDAKARFPKAPEPSAMEPANSWWGALLTPPRSDPLVVDPGSGAPLDVQALPAPDAAFLPVQRAVVVAPPRSPAAPDPDTRGMGAPPALPIERAIVVAPPRGEAAVVPAMPAVVAPPGW